MIRLPLWLLGAAVALLILHPAQAQTGAPVPVDSAAEAVRDAGQAAVDAEAEDRVEVLPLWKAGLRERTEVVRRRRDTEGERVLRQESSRQPYEVEVVATDGFAARLRWAPRASSKPLDTELLQNELGQAELLARLARDGFLLDFDAEGAYAGLANIDDVARLVAAFAGQLDTLFAALPREMQGPMTAMMARMQRPEMVEQSVAGPFQLAYQFHGRSIWLGQREVFPDTLDVPLLGMHLSMRSVLETRRLSADRAEVVLKQRFDPEALRALVARLPQSFGLADVLPRDALAGLDSLNMRMTDRMRWIYDTRNGDLVSVRHDRITDAGPRRRIDTTVVRRLSASGTPGR